jgi:hypothetical protein
MEAMAPFVPCFPAGEMVDSVTQPRTAPSPAAIERLLEIVTGAGMVALVGYAFIVWPSLPARVPVHFGVSGPPDAWGSRATLAMLPAVAVALYLGLSVGQRFPHTYRFPVAVTPGNAARLFAVGRRLILALKAVTCAVLGYLFWLSVDIAQGRSAALPVWFFPATVASIAAVVGTAMFKMKRATTDDIPVADRSSPHRENPPVP